MEALGHRGGRPEASSTVEQPFSLNDTIGFLKAPAAATVRAGAPALSAVLHPRARSAGDRDDPQPRPGSSSPRCAPAGSEPGPRRSSWDGRTPRTARSRSPGRYTLVVSAMNELGRSDLSQVFVARRG